LPQEEMQNPLPDFLDPITLVEVVMPAISPSGHVMRYSMQSVATRRTMTSVEQVVLENRVS
jgi:hypothetical protein